MRNLFILLALVFALPSQSATVGRWTDCNGGNQHQLNAKKSYCWTPTAATDDSPPISMGQCENLDIQFWDLYDGVGTASTVTYEIQTCPSGTDFGSAGAGWNDTALGNACETFQGTTSGSTTQVAGGTTVGLLRVLHISGTGNPTEGTWEVKCNE